MRDRQEQRAGDGAINVQAGNDVIFAVGVTYEDARAIADSVFRENFLTMQDEAREVAAQRAQEVLDQFMEKMQAENADPAPTVRDPDMQFALFDAQKAFARSGDRDLSNILTDILVRRAQEPQRTTLQLVLNESLQVAPKLNAHHLDLLTLVWFLRGVQLQVANTDQLFTSLERDLTPFCQNLRHPDSSFSHLQYAGCGVLEIAELSLTRALATKYPILFPVQETNPEPERAFRAHSNFMNWIAEYWSTSQAKNFQVTSVGIAIAHAHFVARFPHQVVPPLEQWVR